MKLTTLIRAYLLSTLFKHVVIATEPHSFNASPLSSTMEQDLHYYSENEGFEQLKRIFQCHDTIQTAESQFLATHATLWPRAGSLPPWISDVDPTGRSKLLMKGYCLLPFCGPIFSGKSTLINALLGIRLLPAQPSERMICLARPLYPRQSCVEVYSNPMSFVHQKETEKYFSIQTADELVHTLAQALQAEKTPSGAVEKRSEKVFVVYYDFPLLPKGLMLADLPGHSSTLSPPSLSNLKQFISIIKPCGLVFTYSNATFADSELEAFEFFSETLASIDSHQTSSPVFMIHTKYEYSSLLTPVSAKNATFEPFFINTALLKCYELISSRQLPYVRFEVPATVLQRSSEVIFDQNANKEDKGCIWLHPENWMCVNAIQAHQHLMKRTTSPTSSFRVNDLITDFLWISFINKFFLWASNRLQASYCATIKKIAAKSALTSRFLIAGSLLDSNQKVNYDKILHYTQRSMSPASKPLNPKSPKTEKLLGQWNANVIQALYKLIDTVPRSIAKIKSFKSTYEGKEMTFEQEALLRAAKMDLGPYEDTTKTFDESDVMASFRHKISPFLKEKLWRPIIEELKAKLQRRIAHSIFELELCYKSDHSTPMYLSILSSTWNYSWEIGAPISFVSASFLSPFLAIGGIIKEKLMKTTKVIDVGWKQNYCKSLLDSLSGEELMNTMKEAALTAINGWIKIVLQNLELIQNLQPPSVPSRILITSLSNTIDSNIQHSYDDLKTIRRLVWTAIGELEGLRPNSVSLQDINLTRRDTLSVSRNGEVTFTKFGVSGLCYYTHPAHRGNPGMVIVQSKSSSQSPSQGFSAAFGSVNAQNQSMFFRPPSLLISASPKSSDEPSKDAYSFMLMPTDSLPSNNVQPQFSHSASSYNPFVAPDSTTLPNYNTPPPDFDSLPTNSLFPQHQISTIPQISSFEPSLSHVIPSSVSGGYSFDFSAFDSSSASTGPPSGDNTVLLTLSNNSYKPDAAFAPPSNDGDSVSVFSGQIPSGSTSSLLSPPHSNFSQQTLTPSFVPLLSSSSPIDKCPPIQSALIDEIALAYPLRKYAPTKSKLQAVVYIDEQRLNNILQYLTELRISAKLVTQCWFPIGLTTIKMSHQECSKDLPALVFRLPGSPYSSLVDKTHSDKQMTDTDMISFIKRCLKTMIISEGCPDFKLQPKFNLFLRDDNDPTKKMCFSIVPQADHAAAKGKEDAWEVFRSWWLRSASPNIKSYIQSDLVQYDKSPHKALGDIKRYEPILHLHSNW